MGKKVRSAKGVAVDFDLIKIKQQMASAPKPTTVQARENFIDQKFKRRIKKATDTAKQQVVQSAGIEEPVDDFEEDVSADTEDTSVDETEE